MDEEMFCEKKKNYNLGEGPLLFIPVDLDTLNNFKDIVIDNKAFFKTYSQPIGYSV
jgi:hypothetical protein